MKWFVLALVMLNALVWKAGDLWIPERLSATTVSQPLPRVSDLKINGEAAPENIPDENQVAKVELGAEAVPESLPELQSAAISQPDTEEAEVSVEPLAKADSEVSIEQVCLELGWFDSADLAREAYRELGSPGRNMQTLQIDRILQPLHWVIVPPRPEAQALTMFRDLQRRGIDSYLVTQGENKNAISLGLFQSLEAAENVLAQKKRQNLNAVLAKFPRNQISYALVFEAFQSPDSAAVKARISDFQSEYDRVEIGPCEGIATATENP